MVVTDVEGTSTAGPSFTYTVVPGARKGTKPKARKRAAARAGKCSSKRSTAGGTSALRSASTTKALSAVPRSRLTAATVGVECAVGFQCGGLVCYYELPKLRGIASLVWRKDKGLAGTGKGASVKVTTAAPSHAKP